MTTAVAGFIIDIVQHFNTNQLWRYVWAARFSSGFCWFFSGSFKR
jgi:hypothetical protein